MIVIVNYGLNPNSPEVVFAALAGYIESMAKEIPAAMRAEFEIVLARLDMLAKAKMQEVAAATEGLKALTQSALVQGVLDTVSKIAGVKTWRDWIIAATAGMCVAGICFGSGWSLRGKNAPASQIMSNAEYQALRTMSDAEIAAAVQVVKNGNMIECLVDPSICKIPPKMDSNGRKYVNINVWLEPRK